MKDDITIKIRSAAELDKISAAKLKELLDTCQQSIDNLREYAVAINKALQKK